MSCLGGWQQNQNPRLWWNVGIGKMSVSQIKLRKNRDRAGPEPERRSCTVSVAEGRQRVSQIQYQCMSSGLSLSALVVGFQGRIFERATGGMQVDKERRQICAVGGCWERGSEREREGEEEDRELVVDGEC